MTAAPTTLTVGDRKFQIGPFRYLELGIIQRFLNERHAAARGAGKPPQVGDGPEWTTALFASVEGTIFFLDLLFSKLQEFTPDDLDLVLAHVGPKQIQALFLVAMEESPVDEGDDAPKPEAAPPTT